MRSATDLAKAALYLTILTSIRNDPDPGWGSVHVRCMQGLNDLGIKIHDGQTYIGGALAVLDWMGT